MRIVTKLKIVVRDYLCPSKTRVLKCISGKHDHEVDSSSSNKGTNEYCSELMIVKLQLGALRDQETSRILLLQKWCSNASGGLAVRGLRSRVGRGSRIDTLNKTSGPTPTANPRVGRRNTHLVPGRGTVHTHGFTDITIARLKDAIVVVSGHVPGAL